VLKVLISIRNFREVTQDMDKSIHLLAPQSATDLIPNLFIMGQYYKKLCV
jgi:hypothetical protein